MTRTSPQLIRHRVADQDIEVLRVCSRMHVEIPVCPLAPIAVDVRDHFEPAHVNTHLISIVQNKQFRLSNRKQCS